MSLSIKEALRKAAEILIQSDAANEMNDEPFNAKILLQTVLNKDLTFLIAHDDEILSDNDAAKFFAIIERRADGEPLQYITGKQEFYNLEIAVAPGVLIPRPETEILVEIAVDILQRQANKSFCDVGVGSGCISIAILKNVKESRGVALDISPQALEIARENAAKHKVIERLETIESNVFDGLQPPEDNLQFAVIVSNPPYISSLDAPDLPREIIEFEPHGALFAGADGFDVVRKLLRQSPDFLIEKGYLMFEIGFGQAAEIENLIDPTVWNLLEIRRDLQNIERVVVLQKRC